MIKGRKISELLKNEYGIVNYTSSDLKGHIDLIQKIKFANKNYVLKISVNNKMTKRRLDSQISYVEYLNKNGFLTPKIISTIKNKSYASVEDYKTRYAILFEFINNLKSFDIKRKSVVIQFANYIADLHSISLKFEGTKYWYYEPMSEEYRKVADLEKYSLKSKSNFIEKFIGYKKVNIKAFEKLAGKLRTGMLLNDISEGNIFVKNKSFVVIDWNISSKGYFAEELSWIITWFFIDNQNLNNLPIFLETYLKKFPLNKWELEVLSFLPISYSYLMWNVITKCKTEKEAVELDKKVKITRKYLIDAFYFGCGT